MFAFELMRTGERLYGRVVVRELYSFQFPCALCDWICLIDTHQDEDMYFREPAQLLQIFADLEERSLFLIQNCQETEEGLEELRQKFSEAEVTMCVRRRVLKFDDFFFFNPDMRCVCISRTEKNASLHQSVNELGQKIAAEHERANALRERA